MSCHTSFTLVMAKAKFGCRQDHEHPSNSAGQPGEQWTMFFKDPSGNALEFKAMTNPENLFAKYFVS